VALTPNENPKVCAADCPSENAYRMTSLGMPDIERYFRMYAHMSMLRARPYRAMLSPLSFRSDITRFL